MFLQIKRGIAGRSGRTGRFRGLARLTYRVVYGETLHGLERILAHAPEAAVFRLLAIDAARVGGERRVVNAGGAIRTLAAVVYGKVAGAQTIARVRLIHDRLGATVSATRMRISSIIAGVVFFG